MTCVIRKSSARADRGVARGVDRHHAALAVPDQHHVISGAHAGLLHRLQDTPLVGRRFARVIASPVGDHAR